MQNVTKEKNNAKNWKNKHTHIYQSLKSNCDKTENNTSVVILIFEKSKK